MQIPRFSLRQLGYFVAIAEAGSIRAACDRLNVSHAALSQAMNDLEQALGGPLLIRQRARGVSLTSAGMALFTQACALLQAADDIPRNLDGVQTRLAGRLSIGCYTTLAPTLIPRLFAGFRERHPQVELELIEGSTDEITVMLRNGRCETALLYAFSLDADIASEPLCSVAPHVVLAADHALAGSPCIDLRELIHEPLVLFEVAPALANTMDVFEQLGLRPRIGFRTVNFELTRALVARGFGYTVLLQRPAIDVSYEGLPLVTRAIKGYARELFVVAAHATSSRQTQRAEAFRRFCREAAGDLSHRPAVFRP